MFTKHRSTHKRDKLNKTSESLGNVDALNSSLLSERLHKTKRKAKAQPGSPSYVLSELKLNQELFQRLKATEHQLELTEEKLESQVQVNFKLSRTNKDLKMHLG